MTVTYEQIEDIRRDFFKVKSLIEQNEVFRDMLVTQGKQIKLLQSKLMELESYVYKSLD